MALLCCNVDTIHLRLNSICVLFFFPVLQIDQLSGSLHLSAIRSSRAVATPPLAAAMSDLATAMAF